MRYFISLGLAIIILMISYILTEILIAFGKLFIRIIQNFLNLERR